MKAICNGFNCKHLAFLQPMKFFENLNLEERLIFINEGLPYYKDFEDNHENDVFIDLKNLFVGMNDCFIDTCHYSEKGEELLASEVMKYI